MRKQHTFAVASTTAFLLAVALLAIATARADDAKKPPSTPPYPEVRTRTEPVFTLKSAEGREYRIFVSAPDGAAPAGGFPVLYVVDGNAWFGVAAEIARLNENEHGASLVVGVGYPTRGLLDIPDRRRDLTPAGSRVSAGEGEADTFIRFIQSTLKPDIERRYSVNRTRQALFGHSLGGLFTLHVLFTQPDAFQSYIAASPSIWRHDRAILEEAKSFLTSFKAKDASPRLLLTVGHLEQHSTPAFKQRLTRLFEKHPEMRAGQTLEDAIESYDARQIQARMVDNGRELIEQLSAGGLAAEFVVFAGEDHMSVVPAAMSRAVPFALSIAE